MIEPYYADEFATLYHGDAVDVLPELDARSCVDAVLTDPPYSSGGRRENARSLRKSMTRSVSDEDWIAGDSMSTTGFVWLMRAVATRAKPLLRPGAHFLSFIDWRMHGNLCGALESADYRQHPTLVWDKQHFGMGAIFRNQHEWIVHFSYGPPADPARRDVGNVLRCPPIRDGIHPTEKPTGLLAQIVTTVCPEGGLVLDMFTGSGPVLLAAKLYGRRSIGIDEDERWCEATAKRLAQTVAVAPMHRPPAPDVLPLEVFQ